MANAHPKVSNLKPFKKGSSGNPGGRTRGEVDMLGILNELLAATDPASKQSKARALMAAWIAAGIDGDTKAIGQIVDRQYGRVESRMERSVFEERVELLADQAAAAAASATAAATQAADHEALVALLMGEYDLSRELAEDLLSDIDVAYAAEVAKGWSLTDELCNRILGAPIKPRVPLARKDEIIHAALVRAGLVESDEPDEPEPPPPPEPRCGFLELPPPLIRPPKPPGVEPEPWPVDELAAAAIPAPEPPIGPPILPGEFHYMPGFGNIQIRK